MKVHVEKDVLSDAVAWAARYLPARAGSSPQLACLRIAASGDSVTVSGFDYETSAQVTVPAKVAEDDVALVSGRLLADICRALPDQPVGLTAEGSRVSLTCGSSRFTLQTMSAGDYPDLPPMPSVIGTVGADAFALAASQTITAAGHDDMLPALTGVKLEFEGPRLTMTATDRFRLSLRELEWGPRNMSVSASALVPARVLGDTARSVAPGTELDIALPTDGSGGLLGFVSAGAGGERRTTTRLIDAAFPNVRQLFPSTATSTAVVEVRPLLESVKRVSLVAGRNTSIRLAFTDGELTMEAGNGEEAQATESVAASLTGDDIAIGFNPSYLLDGLGAIQGSHVHVAMTTPAKPAAFAAADGTSAEPDLSFRYLLMPLRMQA
ncbi:MAG TPA: DNA polymerase III subunit beta [Nocardioidaceae bacterium]|nr:DNA polymerase III subunit beta [Nocardioidaceae bacterium]